MSQDDRSEKPANSASDELREVGGAEIRVARKVDRTAVVPSLGERLQDALPARGTLPGAVDQHDVAHCAADSAGGSLIAGHRTAPALARPLGAQPTAVALLSAVSGADGRRRARRR